MPHLARVLRATPETERESWNRSRVMGRVRRTAPCERRGATSGRSPHARLAWVDQARDRVDGPVLFFCPGRANRPRKQPFRTESQLHSSPTDRVGKRRCEERQVANKTTAQVSAKAARGSDDPAARIRLVRVITRLNVGGPALHTMLLTERLDPARYDSLLVAGVANADEGDYLALHGRAADRVVRVPTLRREIHPAADGAALVELVRLMRRIRPHVVHTHTAKAGVLGRVAARLARVPVVVHTYHGHVFEGYFGSRRARLFLSVERAVARRTDCLLAVSGAVRRDLLALGVGQPEQFRVVPLGLDLDRFVASDTWRGGLRAELGLPPEAPLVGIIARLVHIKAHEVFLRAAARVAREVPGSRFVLVGDGERRAELETLAMEHGLAGRAHFLGWRRDLERVYADLDVVVLTSRNEGLPVAVIEAMAAGRPVVATRVGGVADVVEDGVTGHLASSGDAEAVAAAVVDLLLDPKRSQTMGQAGRERVVQRFQTGRLLSDLDGLYRDLLRARGIHAGE